MSDIRSEVSEFLSSRRARITPEQAGLPAYGGNRRVPGLRREEVALLSGVSVDYYTRLERGNLAGASESVLDALAATLRLDEAERIHLFDLARAAGPSRRRPSTASTVGAAVRQVLEAITTPAWVRNARHDILATNRMGRALYAPIFETGGPVPNTTRAIFLEPSARSFWRDFDRIASDAAAMLRLEAGHNPHDRELMAMIGELSTRSELFRQKWAAHDVKLHRSGVKRLRHPEVGDLDLDYESMELPSAPGLTLNVYTAAPGTPSADGLALLVTWAATQDAAAADAATDAAEATSAP